ncbi:MAG TPA: nucleotidyltransferase family protein [Acidimicrobiales bacterium]
MVVFADFADHGPIPSENAWLVEGPEVIGHGLAGVARRLIHERSLTVPPDITRAIQEAQFEELTMSALAVNRSQAGLAALEAAGVHYAVTKGPGIAILGRAVSDRPYVDLDVVVDPADFGEARNVLARGGFTEREETRQPWSTFDRHCREAVNLRTPIGGSIDLHHRVSPWFWSGELSRAVLAASVPRTGVFGVELPLASPVHNLLACALHVVSDKGRPGQTVRVWRDLVVLVAACDVDEVVQAAAATGLVEWLAWILGCLPVDVRPRELMAKLDGQAGDVRGRFRLTKLMPPGIGANPLLGHAFRLPVPNAALYVAGMLMPSPTFLRHRYPDRGQRYLTWWRDSFRSITT